jgi:thiamine-phosphate pyrophosphorylase
MSPAVEADSPGARMKLLLPPVYPITDKRLSGFDSHLRILNELVRGGATLVQIRDKETPLDELLADLTRCVEFAERHEARLIVNDRCDLALCCGAHGVHLGQEDLPAQPARELLGRERIIGVSTHNLRQVRDSSRLAIDYIGYGPVFPTSTKDAPAPVVGIRRLRAACASAAWPVVAIGGIGPGRIRQVLEAGAASAAVISAAMAEGRIARNMESLLREATAR